jgi:predicted  nucleic acid-binding Zn-ribbon protein
MRRLYHRIAAGYWLEKMIKYRQAFDREAWNISPVGKKYSTPRDALVSEYNRSLSKFYYHYRRS